jgi:hypothetical protein
MNYIKTIKTIMPFVFFFVVSVAFAESPYDLPKVAPGEVDENEDDANAPLEATICGYIVPMLLLGIATAFVLLKKRSVGKLL